MSAEQILHFVQNSREDLRSYETCIEIFDSANVLRQGKVQ